MKENEQEVLKGKKRIAKAKTDSKGTDSKTMEQKQNTKTKQKKLMWGEVQS